MICLHRLSLDCVKHERSQFAICYNSQFLTISHPFSAYVITTPSTAPHSRTRFRAPQLAALLPSFAERLNVKWQVQHWTQIWRHERRIYVYIHIYAAVFEYGC